jgi:predicted lipid-binding transport protein (Tim44 family)
MDDAKVEATERVTVCLTPEVMKILERAASERGRTVEEYASMMLAIHASDASRIQRMMDDFDEISSDIASSERIFQT